MSHRLFDELGSLQRAVIQVLWNRGEASVSEVREALEGEKQPAYTTVLSVLQKLEKAGWVGHRAEGRTYIYSAERSREREGTKAARGFVDRVFGGNPVQLFEHLLGDERLDDDAIGELQRMIDGKRKELGHDR